jgi:hypothetical protein
MVDLFPNSNLATASQPWGREVQKRLANLESQFSLQRTNSATVDAQLQASYRRLDQTVKDLIQADLNIQAALAQSNIAIVDAAAAADDAAAAADDAQNAIDGLIGLGSTGSDYTLNASNIVGGTITGVTFRTASSGTRVELVSTRVDFYGPFGLLGGYIIGGGDASAGTLFLSGGTNASLLLANGAANIIGGGASVSVGNSGNNDVVVDAGNDFLVSATNISINGDGRLNAAGGLQSLFSFNNQVGSGARDLFITSAGNLGTTLSSMRIKEDIENIHLPMDAIFSIEPKSFKFKVDIEEFGKENAPTSVGFIAEEMHDAGLTDFVYYDKDGQVDGISYTRYVVALQAAIKNLNNRLKTLENGA